MTTTTVPLITKYFTADEINFTPGERSFVAWISVEVVDREGDVVVAKGIDFAEYMTNPVVVAIHNYGKWPLGQAEWLKVKTSPKWTGLYGKANVDDDEDSEVVWKKIQGRSVRSVSIGFLQPDNAAKGEWGPPTPEEVRRNPHWAGAKRVIRRCKMVEFSVCPIGMNPAALIEAVSKGLHKPQFSTPEVTVDEPETPAVEPEPVAKATPDPITEMVTKGDPPVKGAGSDSKVAMSDDDEDEPDDDEDDKFPIRKGHYVKVVKGMHKGHMGKVASVHRSGLIPDVDDDVPTTKNDPGCRVKCYKMMGDGHRETEHHIGTKMAHCEKCGDLKPPSRKKGLPDPVTLPPLVGKSDAELAAERLHAMQKAITPEAIKAAVERQIDKVLGAV